jgi:DNA adenine methylase
MEDDIRRWSIRSFVVSPENVSTILDAKPRSNLERAFATLLRNRVSFGGIMCGGSGFLKNGENGKGIASRWYPETLSRRVTDLTRLKNIRIIHGDGITEIEKRLHAWKPEQGQDRTSHGKIRITC